MTDTIPAADVRELAAAIRQALDPPKAALSVERARLVEERAHYVNGALMGLATDADPALWVRIAAEVIRETVNDLPVRYEVQTMLSAPLPLASLRDREHYADGDGLAKCQQQEAHGFPPPGWDDPPAGMAEFAEPPPGWDDPPAGMAEFAEPPPDVTPFPHFPHLPQHVGGNPVCIVCGIDHDAAARLAPPAGYSLPAVEIPSGGAR